MRRVFLIGGIIAVVALIAFLGYYFFFRAAPGATPLTGGPRGGLPDVGTPVIPGAPEGGDRNGGLPAPVKGIDQKFGVVAENPVFAYFVGKDGSATIIQPDGYIVKVSTTGEASSLSQTLLLNLTSASFSADGQKIIAVFGNRESPEGSVFDVTTKTWKPLGSKNKDAAWAPRGYEIVYVTRRNNTDVLETLDLGNPRARPKELLRLHAEDLRPQWIAPGTLLLAQKPSARVQGSLWRFDVKSKTLAPLAVDRRGLETMWNSSGTRGLSFRSGTGGRGGTLGLIDGGGRILSELKFISLASKCRFGIKDSEEFLFCAIPREAEKLASALLPDDYLKHSLFTIDDLYQINLQGGAATALMADAASLFDASELRVIGNRLFFVNRFNQKLYTLLLE